MGPTALQLRYSYLQPRPLVRDHTHDHRFGWITDEVLDYAQNNPEQQLFAYSPLMSGAYENRADRPIDPAFDHPGTTRRLEVLTQLATTLGTTRSAVVLSWLSGGNPPITPIVGISTPDYLTTALSGTHLELSADQRQQLDEVW
jgi:aryl-alcohol dehydrogenase-like predicted oxidoreductase